MGLPVGKKLTKEDIKELPHGNPSPVMDNMKEIIENRFYNNMSS